MFVPYLPCRIGYAPPPGVIIIDVDNDSLRLKHPALWTELETSDTFVVQTRRGFHFYFEGEGLNQTTAAGVSSLPDDHPLRCVDIKVGGRGITILPPSPPYTHLRGRPDRLAPLPDAMMAEFSARPAGRGGVLLRPSSFRSGDSDPVGGEKRPAGSPRHPSLLAEAGRLRARGYDEGAILECLRDLNQRLFDDPKEDDKVIAMARDVCERYAAGEVEPEQKPEQKEAEPKKTGTLPCEPVTDDGLAVGLKRIRAEVRMVMTGQPRRQIRRAGGEWMDFYGLTMKLALNEISKVQHMRRGAHEVPWRVTSSGDREDLLDVVCARVMAEGDGSDTYHRCVNVLRTRAADIGACQTLGDVLDAVNKYAPVLNKYEVGANATRAKKADARAAAKAAGWRYTTRDGVKQWLPPDLARRVNTALVGIVGGRR